MIPEGLIILVDVMANVRIVEKIDYMQQTENYTMSNNN